MNESEKFLVLFGGIFFPIGLIMTVVGIALLCFGELFGAFICLILGVIFGAVGGGCLIAALKTYSKRKKIEKNGRPYTGKIYGYVEDCSGTMNGEYLMNTLVHYFDRKGVEREAVLPTMFVKGSGDFPIGATIDIVEMNSKYTWVKGSVRYEHIAGEEELMDNLPLDPSKLNMVAVECPNCGASFSAAKGFVCKCPYCGGAINN